MGVKKDDNQDDFFSLLAKDQKIEDPFATDEILFRDENGELKILKQGKILDYDGKEVPQSFVAEEVSTPRQKPPVEPRVDVRTRVKLSEADKPINIEDEISAIINQAGINFSDPQAEKRFRNIITLRLREVRDQIQTRETLLSSPLIGGMGFAAETTDRILALINQEFEKLDGKLRGATSQEEPFSDLKAEAKEILAQPLVEAPPLVFKSDQKSPPPVVKPEIKPITQQPSAINQQTQIKPAVNIPRPIISTDVAKPKIEDVKFKPRLISPIEEIRTMTLTDFRRLAPVPKEAAEKILEKINLLEEESFSKKTDAIKAWKENEIYRLYLRLGDQSMEERKSINEVIKEKQQANEPTLTEEELEVVFELNQKLRF